MRSAFGQMRSTVVQTLRIWPNARAFDQMLRIWSNAARFTNWSGTQRIWLNA